MVAWEINFISLWYHLDFCSIGMRLLSIKLGKFFRNKCPGIVSEIELLHGNTFMGKKSFEDWASSLSLMMALSDKS
jgi:hypothetical protein